MKNKTVSSLALRAAAVVCCAILAPAGPASASVAHSSMISIGYVVGNASDPFYASMACGARAEAKQMGVSVNVQGGAQWGITYQTPILDAVLAKHPNALVVVPNDSKAMVPPLKAAAKSGVKIVVVDTTLNDLSFVASHISSDNVVAGRTVADTLAKVINYKGSVFIVGYAPGGASTVDERVQGFDQEMKKYPNIKNLGPSPFTVTGTSDVQNILGFVSRHPDINGAFATAVQAAEDVPVALRQANLVGKVKMVGFDTADVEVKAMHDGVFQALVGQEPYLMGQLAIKQAILAVQGKMTTHTIGTPAVVVTPANLNTPAVQKLVYKFNC